MAQGMHYGFMIPVAAFLMACVTGEDGPAPRPRTNYDFSRFDSLPNPLSRWYPLTGNKNVVGVKFAFRTLAYEQEVDANLAAFALEAGGKPAAAGAYFDLSSQPKNMRRFLDAVGAQEVIPYVTLDPKDWDDSIADQRTFIRLINEGNFDASLSAQAAVLADFGKPILFRWAHEMNGNWYPYSGVFTGAGSDADRDGSPDGPEAYVKAWRRVHGLFAAAGAANLIWIYSPNWESFPDAEWNRPFAYFPGSAYVDLISADTYEHPDKVRRELSAVLDGFYNELGLFLEGREDDTSFVLKPFGLSEFGTYRRDALSKGDWYAGALATIAADSRIQFSFLYNDRNGSQDFSIAGLGGRLKEFYAAARFQFGLVSALARR